MKSTKDSKLEDELNLVFKTNTLEPTGRVDVPTARKELKQLITSEAEHYANQARIDEMEKFFGIDKSVDGVSPTADWITGEDVKSRIAALKKKEKNNTIQRKDKVS